MGSFHHALLPRLATGYWPPAGVFQTGSEHRSVAEDDVLARSPRSSVGSFHHALLPRPATGYWPPAGVFQTGSERRSVAEDDVLARSPRSSVGSFHHALLPRLATGYGLGSGSSRRVRSVARSQRMMFSGRGLPDGFGASLGPRPVRSRVFGGIQRSVRSFRRRLPRRWRCSLTRVAAGFGCP